MTDDEPTGSALRTAALTESPSLPDAERGRRPAGLLDVAYATVDSPVGTLLLAATPRGLVRVAYLDGGRRRCWRSWRGRDLTAGAGGAGRSTSHGASSRSTSPGGGSEFAAPLDWRLARGLRCSGCSRRRRRSPTGASPATSSWRGGREPAGLSRRRQRAGQQPAADHRALPPRAALRRRARRLHRGRGAQEAAALGGGTTGLGSVEGRPD